MAAPGYTKEGLQNGVRNAKQNIKVLEEAIERERRDIANYRAMIDDLERAETLKEEAEAGITLVVDNTDGDSE